ncbi:MAG: hypothetical protein H5T62_14525 [Anaerolineae bacterium]|nr:hypothetical protein [Anaerolineae bacterium]
MTEGRKLLAILSDQPADEDRLNFDPYAKTLADIIADPDTDTPLAIGVFGTWGRGKISLMRMVYRRLQATVETEFPVRAVWFNAWLYSREEAFWRALIALSGPVLARTGYLVIHRHQSRQPDPLRGGDGRRDARLGPRCRRPNRGRLARSVAALACHAAGGTGSRAAVDTLPAGGLFRGTAQPGADPGARSGHHQSAGRSSIQHLAFAPGDGRSGACFCPGAGLGTARRGAQRREGGALVPGDGAGGLPRGGLHCAHRVPGLSLLRAASLLAGRERSGRAAAGVCASLLQGEVGRRLPHPDRLRGGT